MCAQKDFSNMAARFKMAAMFVVFSIFEASYLLNGHMYRYSYYSILIGNHTCPFKK